MKAQSQVGQGQAVVENTECQKTAPGKSLKVAGAGRVSESGVTRECKPGLTGNAVRMQAH